MRGDIKLSILKMVAKESASSGNIIDAFFPYPYSSRSLNKLRREIEENEDSRDSAGKEKKRVYSTINKLKQEGSLVAIDQEWKVTKLGLKKLFKLMKRKSDFPELPSREYESKKTSIVNIVTFDIPEKYRRKRDWLRDALVNLGFIMLQRSVWMAKIILPKEFLEDIKDMEIKEYIQIISVKGEVLDINAYRKTNK